jgi:hypothetical protein
MRCYVRSGKGLGRLREAWISGNFLKVKGWWGSKQLQIQTRGRHEQGLFLDFVEFTTSEGKPVSVYLTKDWAASYREAM